MSEEPIPAPASPAAPKVKPARPSWLPPHVPYNDNWDPFIRALYIVFEQDFKRGYPRFRALPIWHDRRIEPEDKYSFEEAFWHLVTRNEGIYNRTTRCYETDRYPDPERAGRLPWAKPILDHETDPEVTAWDCDEESKRGGGIVVRTYVWLKKYDYVVILERQTTRRGEIFKLITAFISSFEGKRRDLESRYARRLK